MVGIYGYWLIHLLLKADIKNPLWKAV